MAEFVAGQVKSLSQFLLEAQAYGVSESVRRCGGWDVVDEYPFMPPLITRIGVREFCKRGSLPDGWMLDGNSRLMGQLMFTRDNLALRYLKERRHTYPGGIPPAGRNPARRSFYQPSLPGLEEAGTDEVPLNLILAWDYIDPRDLAQGTVMRIVHPVEAGVYGRAVGVDLSLEVGDDRQWLVDIDAFRPAEEEEDLYALTLENMDGIERAENGGSGFNGIGS